MKIVYLKKFDIFQIFYRAIPYPIKLNTALGLQSNCYKIIHSYWQIIITHHSF